MVTKDGVGSFEDRRPDETKIDSDLPTVDRKVKEGQAQSRSPEQEYAVWTSLVDRIYEKRLNIVAAQDPDGGTWLTVSELSASELEVLHNPKFKNRCLKRLTKICDIQYRELKKVKSYIISLANEPGKLEILDGPVLFHDTSKAMHALFKQYLHYEDVRDLVSNIKLQRELASRQVELIRQRSIEDAGLAALAQKQALMNKPDGR